MKYILSLLILLVVSFNAVAQDIDTLAIDVAEIDSLTIDSIAPDSLVADTLFFDETLEGINIDSCGAIPAIVEELPDSTV